MFANVDAWRAGRDRAELAAHLDRRVGLEIEHVLRGRPAEQVKQDDGAGAAGTANTWFLRHGRHAKEAAQQAERAGFQGIAPRDAVAKSAWIAQNGEHALSPLHLLLMYLDAGYAARGYPLGPAVEYDKPSQVVGGGAWSEVAIAG